MNFKKDLTNKIFGFWQVISFNNELSEAQHRTYWNCKCICGVEKPVLGQNLTSGHSTSCGCQSRNKKKNNLQGKKFGRLTVLYDTGENTTQRNIIWHCKCDCGNECNIPGRQLTSGKTTSCGCYRQDVIRHHLEGQRFGKLIAIEPTNQRNNSYIVWKCKCDCGNICYISSYCLVNGHTNSCGCLNSKGEAKIKNIFDQNNIIYLQQYSFPDLLGESKIPYRFDFAIFDKNNNLQYLLEYQGEQHYICSNEWWNTKEQFEKVQKNDKAKVNYCKERNIPLLLIKYDQYETLNLLDLIPKGENIENFMR